MTIVIGTPNGDIGRGLCEYLCVNNQVVLVKAARLVLLVGTAHTASSWVLVLPTVARNYVT